MTKPPGSALRVITPETKSLGEFTVRRALPDKQRQRVGPFVFFDHMGPADFAPGTGVDVRPHPHIGIATITYLFAGQIRHRDSLGYDQVITPGAVNWMTAGRGIVHSERTPDELKASGSHLHGIQTWIALPLEKEETEPHFEHYPESEIPNIERPGNRIRVVTGSAYGVASPVATASETLYIEARLEKNARLAVPDDCEELAVYVVEGELDIDGSRLGPGSLAILPVEPRPDLHATTACHCMLLGGARLAGDRTLWWNFVHSSRARIEQAKRDWREGRFDPVPGDDEFIPLPES